MVDRAAAKAGFVDEREPRYEDLPVQADAERFVAIATGKVVRFGDHLNEYLATLTGNKPKTVDQKRSTVEDFAAAFHHTGDVHRKAVQKWVNQQVQDGQGVNTVQRYLSELRGYWRYLQSVEVVPEDALPFDKLTVPKPPKNGNGDARQPFEAKDVVKLWRKAKADKDQELADLIEMDMWTGARIEELCSLKIAKIGRGYFDIDDAKTEAGVRRVPIHSKLKKTVARLVKASEDGYLLSRLTENKYGDRSNAIGKRFGRMKTDMGFGPQFVFHSIRKTVATQFENAKVPEGVAADIIGHDKPTMTYGLYSGGASMETKRKAIEKLRYPA
jgi:integrase